MELPPEEMIFGQSGTMRSIRQKLEKVCGTNIPVLMRGKGGTGKETLAQWIHSCSPRKAGPFVKVNCAAIPGSLLESELFGYEKGAFTGAHASKPGRVELADKGTLFLDEIAELDLGLQAKLLQFLQDGRFSRIGDYEERRVEARVICATNRDLEKEIDLGTFRVDFFYRINVIQIVMPRLADRREDIVPLSDYFLARCNAHFQRTAPRPPKEFFQMLEAYDWPGNIRELENRITRYVILGADDDFGRVATERGMLVSIPSAQVGALPLKRLAKEAGRQLERKLILSALEANHWSRRRTAEALKISYRALIYKIREAGLPQRNGRGNHSARPLPSGADPSKLKDK